MANKQLAQIETMLADRAPQLGDYDAVESVKRILDERDEANKSKDAMLYAALCDMPSPLVQEVVDTLELWLNDGRFYVANSAPAEQSVRRLEQLILLHPLVVEELGQVALPCVTQDGDDAGFRVVRQSDDDTYMYVNINTAKVSTGLCVSRYDVTIYSHAAAKLPHTESPVLLQVELLHKGGIAGGAPDAHANGVTKSLIEFVDQFSTRIRNAGK